MSISETTATATQQPAWKSLTTVRPDWTWRGNVLQENGASEEVYGIETSSKGIGSFIVENIYGRQNKTRSARRLISEAVARLRTGDYGLNFGAGKTRYAPTLLNLDLIHGPHVDMVSAGSLVIPLKNESLNLVVCQEVLEHVDRPFDALAEFHRILKPGGELVLQLPFIIGYHPGPTDFWRFSTEAYAMLLPSQKWQIIEKHITVGHGSGLHRILTEFVAVHFSLFGGKVYRAVKGVSAILLSPLILFDALTPYLPEKDRIAGGYIVRAKAVK